MRYLGSKARHADEILKIVLAKRKPGQTYVEPFVGGANVISRVPAADGPRIGADINAGMIALHKALAAGWLPPEHISKSEYIKIKNRPQDYPLELVAYTATAVSFGSQWFGTYAADVPSRSHKSGRESALNDVKGFNGVAFIHSAYDSLVIPPNSLIYCDPPYASSLGYVGAAKTIKVGDDLGVNTWKANKFWKWADQMVDVGHTIFVSEYSGPSPSIYPMIAVAGRKEAGERATALQRDSNSTSTQIEEALAECQRLDDAGRLNAEALAARWKSVWEKTVIVGVDNVNSGGKTETEKLFHRES